MTLALSIVASIILLSVILNKFTSKAGIPMLFAFILLGMFFGSDGVIKIHFDNFALSEQICSIALIFIIFYGGFCTNWKEAKHIAVQAILLSSLGVLFTALLVGAFCFYVLKIEFLESMLIGAVISSTDAASVFSILRSHRLNLKYNTASMLELESGSNDPFSYMLTIIVLSMMKLGTFDVQASAIMLFQQVFIGLGVGAIVAYFAIMYLKKLHFGTEGFDAIFIIAIAIFSYAIPNALGGNGYLSAYFVGILLGNSSIGHKKTLVHFFDGLNGLMQILIFFLLGLLSFPSKLIDIAPHALAIAVFLTFIARPVATLALMLPFKAPLNQMTIVAWTGLRGAASIVFAIFASNNPDYLSNDIFHIVFFIVLFSILVQGTLIPWASRKLNMIDDTTNVLKTFNDYSQETAAQFIQLSIGNNHPWISKSVQALSLPPELLLSLILRGDERIIPRGNVEINRGDILVLATKSVEDRADIVLTEYEIEKKSKWIGKEISKIRVPENKLVVLMKRQDEIIIPSGKTVVEQGDIIVMNEI